VLLSTSIRVDGAAVACKFWPDNSHEDNMPADPQFDYWTREIQERDEKGFVATREVPFIQDRETTAEISGYWRVWAARTKTNWPVLTWIDTDREGGSHVVQWGGGRPKVYNDDQWHEFVSQTFPHCAAIREAEFKAAVESGVWPDGLRAIPQDAEERFDIIPDTDVDQGGNNPVDESGEAVDAYHQQVSEKLAALVEKGTAIGAIDSQVKAEAAAKIRDDILALGTMGEAKRKEEAKPFDEAKARVQAKWVPVLKPASELAIALLNKIDAWKRAEKRRLEELERKRVAEETRKRLEAEAAARAAEAAQRGEEAPPAPSAAEIEQQAQAEAQAAPVEVQAPRVQGSATARATSKAKRKTGKITDVDKFIAAIREQADFKEWLQDKADKLARANTALDGMEIDNG
jgi:hypothetical protein